MRHEENAREKTEIYLARDQEEHDCSGTFESTFNIGEYKNVLSFTFYLCRWKKLVMDFVSMTTLF